MWLPSHLRLRTQLLLASIAISSMLTIAALFVARASVEHEVSRQTNEALAASVHAFERVELQQASELLRTSAMLAELPTLKALMTTEDAATIQDASAEFWRLSGTDVLILADTSSRVMAVHAGAAGLAPDSALRLIAASRQQMSEAGWCHDGADLFRIVARPIVAGSGADKRVLGLLVVATRINAAVAHQIAHFSATEVALATRDTIVASTFDAVGQQELASLLSARSTTAWHGPQAITIGGRGFEIAAIDLKTAPSAPLRCYMLLPLDSAYGFLSRLNRTLFILGLFAALLGAVLVTLISGAITRPLDKLVTAVRAFGAGDSTYAIEARGSAEVTELAQAFESMRCQLSESQRKQIEAERLAALGRAATSISHDLRHHLAALVANAEFLHDAEELGFDRDEIYREIQRASGQMTGLIDSLLEIGRDRRALQRTEGDLQDIVQRAADAVRSIPDHRGRNIDIRVACPATGSFDVRKLESAFFNMLLNACEAAPQGSVGVTISANDGNLECHVWDTGLGIPESIRSTLFEPFVSAGKNNGTGLGLAIASKVVHDHDGEIFVEQTSAAGTSILVRIPRHEVRTQTQPADLTA